MADMSDEQDEGVVALPAVLDLSAAEPLQRSLLERVRSATPLVVVGSAVERISTAAVQVLLAAAADARARGNPFEFRDPSPALADALVDLGVASHLGS
jgi:anti-anti-sigma regulatory factor